MCKDKILNEYKGKFTLYNEFACSFSSLLENMLKKEGYKYHLYSRLKNEESLAEKIDRKELKGKIYRRLKDIQDVVGVRVIFYTENDRKRFILKLQKELGEALNIKPTFKVSGYRAIHAIAAFNKDRLKLTEYSEFEGLECEIQLALILEHAWAEIEHDILYKEKSGLRETDRMTYLYMKGRMERIMKNHITKASEELEKVVLEAKKFERKHQYNKPPITKSPQNSLLSFDNIVNTKM